MDVIEGKWVATQTGMGERIWDYIVAEPRDWFMGRLRGDVEEAKWPVREKHQVDQDQPSKTTVQNDHEWLKRFAWINREDWGHLISTAVSGSWEVSEEKLAVLLSAAGERFETVMTLLASNGDVTYNDTIQQMKDFQGRDAHWTTNQRKLLEWKIHFERNSSVTTVVKKGSYFVEV